MKVWNWVWFYSTGGASGEECPFVVRLYEKALFWRFHNMWKIGSNFAIIVQPRYGMIVGILKIGLVRCRLLWAAGNGWVVALTGWIGVSWES